MTERARAGVAPSDNTQRAGDRRTRLIRFIADLHGVRIEDVTEDDIGDFGRYLRKHGLTLVMDVEIIR